MPEPGWECFKGRVDAIVRGRIQVDNMGLLIRPLGAMIAGNRSVVIEMDPLGFLIEPIAHWDVEVSDFTIIEGIASRGFVEPSFVVEDVLFEVMESIFILFI
jgi:hypothetical protein